MIKNVILDWSGTVVNDLPPVLLATNALMRETGLPELTLEEFRAEFCLPMEPFYERRMPGLSMEVINEGYHRHFPQFGHAVEILPNAREFLEFCYQTGRRLFVLSTIDPSHFVEQSGKFGVAHFFEHAYTGIPDKRRKIGEILATHDLLPHETLFAGDMVHDIHTAHSAGVLAVGLLSGFDSREKITAANPDVLVRDLGDLQLLMESTVPTPPSASARPETIRVQGLQIDARVGVPDQERAQPQRLLLDLVITPAVPFADLGDDVSSTVDYFELCEAIRAWAAAGSWKLIETLADDLRGFILARPRVVSAQVAVRKFILPYTEHVGVEC